MRRQAWMGAGLGALALGTAGIAVPLLPTVPFYILAAFCFARGNPIWEDRLLDHPRYGPHVRQWRERRAISRKGKVAALTAMGLGVAVTWATLGSAWMLIPLAVMAISGTWIWTRPE